MSPLVWLTLKIFPGLVVFGFIGFFIGWLLRAKSVASKFEQLEGAAQNAEQAAAKAKSAADKLKKNNQSLEKQLRGSKKQFVSRDEHDRLKADLKEAKAASKESKRRMESARHELEGFRETSVSGAEFSDLRRDLERYQGEVKKLKRQAKRAEEKLKSIQSKEITDIVGFEDERDSQLKELRVENASLREILSKVQTGEGRESILQLADELRVAKQGVPASTVETSEEAATASAAISSTPTTDLLKLRNENKELSEQLTAAKKKLVQSKLSFTGDSPSASDGDLASVQQERDQLKIELAKAKASGGKSNEEDLRSEITRIRSERDALILQLTKANSASSTPAEVDEKAASDEPPVAKEEKN